VSVLVDKYAGSVEKQTTTESGVCFNGDKFADTSLRSPDVISNVTLLKVCNLPLRENSSHTPTSFVVTIFALIAAPKSLARSLDTVSIIIKAKHGDEAKNSNASIEIIRIILITVCGSNRALAVYPPRPVEQASRIQRGGEEIARVEPHRARPGAGVAHHPRVGLSAFADTPGHIIQNAGQWPGCLGILHRAT
jgi:hypothetical protein